MQLVAVAALGGILDGAHRGDVVGAVVTGALGVLVVRRRDGVPPCSFPGGKLEPGETLVEAAVREVREEIGLAVRPLRALGRRIHPSTGRAITYVACQSIADASVSVESRTLVEARWIGLAELDELMPDVFPPVRDHLEDILNTPDNKDTTHTARHGSG